MSHEGEVQSTSRSALDLAMKLAFLVHGKATHLLNDKENGCLVFFWHEPTPPWHAEKLANPMSGAKAADLTWEWLRSTLKKEKRPTTYADGLNAGFRLRFGGEFRLYWKAKHSYLPDDGSPYGICAVFPVWHEIHK